MSLREDVQKKIDDSGISIARLARLADIHPDGLYKFLKGETEMTAANLDKLFGVLKVYKKAVK